MSEPLKIKGIVVQSSNMGDNGKMLNILTGERGVISVSAQGVKSLKNKNAQGVMPLCYSEFVLSERGEIYSLSSAEIIESFYSLREDMTSLAYGVYFAQLAAYCVGRDNGAEEEMKLLLNTLFLLAKNRTRCDTLKCVFELKMCEYSGFAPYLESCECGSEAEFFDAESGEAVCRMHKTPQSEKMSENAFLVCRYVQHADLKEALTFDTPREIADEISGLIEKFMANQLGRLPRSLEYINKII